MINDIIKKLEDNLSLHNINCKQYRLLDKQLKNYILFSQLFLILSSKNDDLKEF